MYWVRKIEDERSASYTYLLCDSFEEFVEDTAGVLGAPGIWDAQIGKLSRAEAREKDKKSRRPFNFDFKTEATGKKRQSHDTGKKSDISPNVRLVMEELGAIISTAVIQNLYGVGREEGMREIRELIINIKDGERFRTIKKFIPGYESIFDGTINKKTQAIGEINPNYVSDYAYAYLDIGMAYYENRDYSKAIENFSEAIKIDQDYLPAYYNRAGNYFMAGDFDHAINDLMYCIKIDPSNEIAKDLLRRIENNRNASKNV